MKLLTVTNLYPGEDLPRHGIFVEERLRHLVADGLLAAEVVALRPGVKTPPWSETRHGIKVNYLPVPTLPLITNWIDPLLWANTLQPVIARMVERTRDDVVLDGHFLYPDGAATALIGKRLGIPVVLTARGSDVNVKCRNILMRQWVLWACARSAAIITVSKALKDRLVEMGVEDDKLTVLRNGVNLEKFSSKLSDGDGRPDNAELSIVSVGHLLEAKGHHIVIEALAQIHSAHLTIIGDGPERSRLETLAKEHGVSDRVRFVGQVSHEDMPKYYRSADVTVLASKREGMPNVILESLACGTRVIATDVGGIGEVVDQQEAGFLMRDRTVGSLVDAFRKLQATSCDRHATREYAAEHLSWGPIVDQQRSLYASVSGE
jgi:glycosyltransferase involved in cell wall biosynthesis